MRAAFVAGTLLLAAAPMAWGLTPAQIYKKAAPAVVLILASDDGKVGEGGTGSIITPEGKIITNAHVVISKRTSNPYRIIYVFLKPPHLTGDNSRDLVNRYKARVLSYSPPDSLDLAVLQMENPPPNLPTIAFADPRKVNVGDKVVAIGHPEQGGLWTLTTGNVSTVIANFNHVKGKNVFQTEASVNRGNSGGPLLDSNANMIGINTMIARVGAGGLAITGVNFSLKSSVAVKWLAGQGMGLAYASPRATKHHPKLVVAVAAEPNKPAAEGARPSASSAAHSTIKHPVAVSEPPPATIVVAEATPKAPNKIREEGTRLGTQKATEKVEHGKLLDPKKAKPTYLTKRRPYQFSALLQAEYEDINNMMKEMRNEMHGHETGGMGLW